MCPPSGTASASPRSDAASQGKAVPGSQGKQAIPPWARADRPPSLRLEADGFVGGRLERHGGHYRRGEGVGSRRTSSGRGTSGGTPATREGRRGPGRERRRYGRL